MSDCLDIEMVTGFDWDDGNVYKNKDKHGLDYWIIEEIFFNNPLLIHQDVKHSEQECRCYALGCSDNGEKLFVVFTLRERKIRVISARLMNKKRGLSMKTLKTIPTFTSQEEEKTFWETHDSSEFMNWSEAKKMRFPKLQKSAKTISIRMPVDMIEEVKVQANKLDIPYQSYLKMIIAQGLKGRTA